MSMPVSLTKKNILIYSPGLTYTITFLPFITNIVSILMQTEKKSSTNRREFLFVVVVFFVFAKMASSHLENGSVKYSEIERNLAF